VASSTTRTELLGPRQRRRRSRSIGYSHPRWEEHGWRRHWHPEELRARIRDRMHVENGAPASSPDSGSQSAATREEDPAPTAPTAAALRSESRLAFRPRCPSGKRELRYFTGAAEVNFSVSAGVGCVVGSYSPHSSANWLTFCLPTNRPEFVIEDRYISQSVLRPVITNHLFSC
jgi:hypothetical protein